jgi:hypothetical protein
VPTYNLRIHAQRLLGLAITAHDEARGVDSHILTKRAVERLLDALAIEELRRRSSCDLLVDLDPRSKHDAGNTQKDETQVDRKAPDGNAQKDSKAHRDVLELRRNTISNMNRVIDQSKSLVQETLRFLRSV